MSFNEGDHVIPLQKIADYMLCSILCILYNMYVILYIMYIMYNVYTFHRSVGEF